MLFRQLFDTESNTYSYLLADSSEALLIDPVLEKTDEYIQLLRELNLTLKFTVDTHTHADHVTAMGRLREITGCSTLMGQETAADCVTAYFKDGDVLSIGNVDLVVLHTPGHTDDSYSFYTKQGQQGYLFTGDTLLIRGTGRTDFQNGSAADQYNSLFQTLLQYPDDTHVYVGHDYKGWLVTTIGEEKKHNPRLQTKTKSEYVSLMDQLDLPMPKMIDIAVPANQACGELTS